MSIFGCNNRSDCTGIAIVASIIIGIIAAFLRITGVITIAPVFLWVVFGIAVVYLAITLIAASIVQNSGVRGCICPILAVLLTGILGAVLTSLVLLAISFATTSIIGAIIVGALLAFFSLILTTTACLVKCILRCSDAD
ncbi:MAG: hypothetical protein IJ366_07105 [Clostridia bacterium]|nr:hypothetical protein [Clostridia bacterium]